MTDEWNDGWRELKLLNSDVLLAIATYLEQMSPVLSGIANAGKCLCFLDQDSIGLE